MFKVIFDYLLSSLGLMILTPFFLIIALWIKLDTSGPVYFRQTRVGLNGKPFKIHKFRTMYVDSNKSGGLTVGNDVRITPSGKFLRKFKLDELPQLLDVLSGKMSLVGPRPELAEFINEYPSHIRSKILSVKPGITDLASVELVDENQILSNYSNPRKAYIEIILPKKQQYYLEYVDNNSIFMDFKIIMLTIKKIVTR